MYVRFQYVQIKRLNRRVCVEPIGAQRELLNLQSHDASSSLSRRQAFYHMTFH